MAAGSPSAGPHGQDDGLAIRDQIGHEKEQNVAAYLVVDTDWKNTGSEARAAFGRTAQPVVERYGGRFLTPPGSRAEPLEGD